MWRKNLNFHRKEVKNQIFAELEWLEINLIDKFNKFNFQVHIFFVCFILPRNILNRAKVTNAYHFFT